MQEHQRLLVIFSVLHAAFVSVFQDVLFSRANRIESSGISRVLFGSAA
jgi:hypothetical protein